MVYKMRATADGNNQVKKINIEITIAAIGKFGYASLIHI